MRIIILVVCVVIVESIKMSWERILKQPRNHRRFLEQLQSKIQQALSDNVSEVQDPSENARMQTVRDGNMLAELRRDLDAYLKKHPTYMDSPADNETRPINLDAKPKL
jgi:hypothetical protein